jgi:hypothetical protein
MARTRFVVFALAMLATGALAEETRVNPVSNAAAGAVGLATAPIISGLTSVSGDAAQGRLCSSHPASLIANNDVCSSTFTSPAHRLLLPQ